MQEVEAKMKKVIVLPICILLIVALIAIAHSREKRNPALRPYRPVSDGELPEPEDPNFLSMKSAAAVDTFYIIRFDFEELDWQGWAQVDNTAQIDTFIHVDDFSGLGGGDFGRLVPLEGSKSMWCGARPDPGDPYLCGWIYLPGYGHGWKQVLVTDSLSFTGTLDFSFMGMFDSELDWDITYLEYDTGEDNWIEIDSYDDVLENQVFVYHLFLALPATKLRFRFESDGAWDDQDGIINTDGAFIVDSLVISDLSGLLDFENFETAGIGAHRANGDGNGISWKADIGEPFGAYCGLYSGIHQDHDPCNTNFSTQIVFFIGSDVPSSSYPGLYDTPFCKGAGGVEAPCQDEMAVSPVIDLTKYSTNRDEIQDADIPPGKLPDLGGLLLRWTEYDYLPLANLVFDIWHVRNVDESGCPGDWKDSGYIYPPNYDYCFVTQDISNLIVEDKMQVALGVADMCQYWYLWYGNCANHTPAPWFDNVRIQRYDASGPQWSSRDLDLFQDQFPTEGTTIEAYVRVDAANDLNSSWDPVIRPGDSAVVRCTSPLGGGIMYDPDGWPQVYMLVRAEYIGCASSCPDHAHPKTQYLYGPSLEGTYGRYVSDDGAVWTTLQCAEARVGPYPGTPVLDRYMVDLNDSLFTRGYMIEYYFSANDSAGKTTYHPEDAPSRADRTYGSGGAVYKGVSYIFEMTCLPLGCSDILYVDDFHGRGTFWGTVEQYFNPAFLAVIPSTNWPERYDVNNPSSLIANGLARSATSSILTCYYTNIIWDSGNLSNGTIGDGSTDSDKTNDCQLLIDFMSTHPDSHYNVGLLILGDDVAQDLAGLTSPQAAQLLTTWCGVEPYPDQKWGSYYSLSGGYTGGNLNPLISGTAGGVFYHGGIPDAWYVFGGCPLTNRFDCLTAAPGATIAATYPDCASHTNIGAAIQNRKINAVNSPISTMWVGHSYMYVRDVSAGAPIIRNHILKDFLHWTGGGPTNPVITETEVPKAWKLSQNFPNPFNPVTTIRFDVKERGHVYLKIYNVAGQLVKTLVDETRDASSYSIPWDGTNNLGADVASGVYFYRMESSNFIKTRKMVLLR